MLEDCPDELQEAMGLWDDADGDLCAAPPGLRHHPLHFVRQPAEECQLFRRAVVRGDLFRQGVLPGEPQDLVKRPGHEMKQSHALLLRRARDVLRRNQEHGPKEADVLGRLLGYAPTVDDHGVPGTVLLAWRDKRQLVGALRCGVGYALCGVGVR